MDGTMITATTVAIKDCPFAIDLVRDHQSGRPQKFGCGAWSDVFKATLSKAPPSLTPGGLPTPPSSPVLPLPIIVAVKRPARSDAKPILQNEARILSYLTSLVTYERFITPFYGILPDSSLVLGAVPRCLEEHIRQQACIAYNTSTTETMSAPVLGSTRIWLDLARKLISALVWLHDHANIVHGDIKPANFLLDQTARTRHDPFPFQPLFIDFSSSHRTLTSAIDSDTPPQGTLSAVTREYTAPELLKSSVLRDPKSTATKASDVFSMAITLLVAATGNTMVYEGSVFQRQAMATQGWQALHFVRGAADMSTSARLPRQGLVERCLDRALLKADLGRVDAETWLQVVDDLAAVCPRKAEATVKKDY
jgi:serine/threonine protein kinase